jgi:hypothetical protein
LNRKAYRGTINIQLEFLGSLIILLFR